MKILPSHKISGQLLDVILDARKELVLVSPYVDLSYSKQVSSALIAARNRGVNIAFYIRHESTNLKSKEQVESIGITPRLIPNLHAKLYFNETTGLIASLNLLSSSIGNSIEIGGQLETPEELDELRLFVAQFITPHDNAVLSTPPVQTQASAPPTSLSSEDRYINHARFATALIKFIDARYPKRMFGFQQSDAEPGKDGSLLTIQAMGNTTMLLLDEATRTIRLHAIVSGREAERFPVKAGKHFTSPSFSYSIYPANDTPLFRYNTIRALQKQPLSSLDLDNLPLLEKKALLFDVVDFVTAAADYKQDYRM